MSNPNTVSQADGEGVGSLGLSTSDGGNEPPASVLAPLLRELRDPSNLGALLCMFWSGRGDTFHPSLMPVLEWLSENCLPLDVVCYFRGYQSGVVQFEGHEHHGLANHVIRIACELPQVKSGLDHANEPQSDSLACLGDRVGAAASLRR